ncbi:MAG: hypothetical protein V1734_04655 [Nanoarchaeota archaeon]
MKTRNILGAIGLAAALGCGNGYSVNNDEPEQADVVQTADGSYTPSDAGNDSNTWRPTGPYGNISDLRVPRGPFNYAPADAGNDETSNPGDDAASSNEGIDSSSDDDAAFSNGGIVDYPAQAQGFGVYCIRKITHGSTHFGFITNYSLSDADGINEAGLVAYGERTKQRFMQDYPGTTEAAYNHSKRNFGNPGNEDTLALYVIDNEGNETEFALKRIECESLDKLLELY